ARRVLSRAQGISFFLPDSEARLRSLPQNNQISKGFSAMVRRFPVPERCIRVSLAVLIFGLAFALASPVFAQNENETTGFASSHVFDGGYFGENVDVLNGNLTVTIPIGQKYVVNKNLDYQLKLIYNS